MLVMVERRRSPGVVAFITASSFLDGVSLGGLRAHLRDTFDELWIVDLGGEGRGALAEENVFAIRTPVAIAFGVNRTGGRPARCRVRYRRIPGTRDEKLDAVGAWRFDDDGWTDIEGDGLASLTPRTASEYRSWPEITDLFAWIHPGSKAGRTWVISASKAVLNRRIVALMEANNRDKRTLFKDSPTGRKVDQSGGRSIMPGEWDARPVSKLASPPEVKKFGYRSFDVQHIVADPRFIDRPGPGWRVRGLRQVFLTTLTSTKLGAGPAVTASAYVPDLHHFRGSYGAKDVMPLWLDGRRRRRPNVPAGLLDVLSAQVGRTVDAEDLAAYVYGLTATGAFTARFSAELAEAAGPVHVPLTADRALFERVVALGRDLLWWHTWGERFGPKGGAQLPDGSAKVLEPVRGVPESYRWCASGQLIVGSGVFEPVSEVVWRFGVSGLRVVDSWLGYRMARRKGKRSSPLDEIGPERWTHTPEL
ncbi:MAG: type ISP restriction/modification enzyme, partial [Acidimicrobiales bacterium]